MDQNSLNNYYAVGEMVNFHYYDQAIEEQRRLIEHQRDELEDCHDKIADLEEEIAILQERLHQALQDARRNREWAQELREMYLAEF